MTPAVALARTVAGIRRVTPAKPRAPFPAIAWAWPTRGRDLLLQAGILADVDSAAAAFRRWLASNVFDDVTYAEQRLLVTISARMPPGVLNASEKNLLRGVERMLWTRAIVSLRATEPALAALSEAGIPVMVIKGGVWSVIDVANLKGRYADDLDLLVRPRDFQRATQLLLAAGWTSPLHEVATGNIGINLERNGTGRLDLHRYPCHQALDSDAAPDQLWVRAVPQEFSGRQLFIPSPTDRLLMAIAHGAIGGYLQADWLVDCAALIGGGGIDWALFESLAQQRHVDASALIVLAYLAGPLGVPVPPDLLIRLGEMSRRRPLRYVEALLLCRPWRDHSLASKVAMKFANAVLFWRRGRVLARLEAAIPAT